MRRRVGSEGEGVRFSRGAHALVEAHFARQSLPQRNLEPLILGHVQEFLHKPSRFLDFIARG
jgi:hypothetical protein